MNRQQTLGHFSRRDYTSICQLIIDRTGKFLTMPKNITGKAVAPQQSSLNEMWGGKRKQKVKVEQPEDASMSVKDAYIGVDDTNSQAGENHIVLLCGPTSNSSGDGQEAPNTKNHLQKVTIWRLTSQNLPKVGIPPPSEH